MSLFKRGKVWWYEFWFASRRIREEVGFLLRVIGAPGDIVRVRLRKQKLLKLKTRSGVGKAYGPEEKARLIEHARQAVLHTSTQFSCWCERRVLQAIGSTPRPQGRMDAARGK